MPISSRLRLLLAPLLFLVTGCADSSPPVDTAAVPNCTLPAPTAELYRDGDVGMWQWVFADDGIWWSGVLPVDSALAAYRAAVEADGGAVRAPVSDQGQDATSEADLQMWADERHNGEMALSGQAGVVEPIKCLDAALFAFQHNRFDQISQPTEFLASVLRRPSDDGAEIMVLLGAGAEMFPPREVYGFERVAAFRDEGWEYLYAIHNHTIQENQGRLALGTPALSTSDVQLVRGMFESAGLGEARVTNGFYTYRVGADGVGLLRSR